MSSMRRAQAGRLFHAASRARDRQQAIDDVHDEVHRRMLLAVDVIGVITTGAGAAQGLSLSLGCSSLLGRARPGPTQFAPNAGPKWGQSPSGLELKIELSLVSALKRLARLISMGCGRMRDGCAAKLDGLSGIAAF
ncbi:hypothetical protein FOMA001_g17703 [Fusarium oxysporum f. sp. matthiolae]|nr:hypothetical protein FOMA001_g17703 [Fusarium oxysporum f. sp. matthiolae]